MDELSQELNSARRSKRTLTKGRMALKKDFWASHEKCLQRVVWLEILPPCEAAKLVDTKSLEHYYLHQPFRIQREPADLFCRAAGFASDEMC